MFKKCKIIKLPGKISNIFREDNGGLCYYNNPVSTDGIGTPQHLYILSDEVYFSHKKGDWVYESDNTIPVYQFTYDICEYPLRRIIASTNPSLNLPRPSDSFIKKYCELGGIDEVMVEYNELVDETQNDWFGNAPIIQKLKVAPDNTITIKKIKESWSREEVEYLTQLAWLSGKTNNTNSYFEWSEANL